MESTNQDPNEVNSLEAEPTETPADTGAAAAGSTPADPVKPTSGDKKPKKTNDRVRGLIMHINIYLLIFVFMMVLGGVLVVVGMQRNKKVLETPTITTQELSQEDLEQINGTETKVGDPKQTLSIESNAIFAGKVLIRDSLDVAGTIKVGSSLNLPGITVSGTSNFDELQTNKLSVAGDTAIQGALTVQKNLTVSSGASFGGPISAPSLTVQNLQLTSDLTITRHIDAGGSTPTKTNGNALGSGGSSSVSGTDTAGTVNIGTGSGTGAGCFAHITFRNKFNATPHVVATPIGSAAGGINWYLNRSSTGFSICTSNAAPTGQNFAFDFIVID